MNCRYCKQKLELNFLNIGKSALANSFTKKKHNYRKKNLILSLCKKCLLVQHSSKVKSHEIFDKYSYFSSYSVDVLKHSKDYVKKINKYLSTNDNILEIACNDGYLLQYFDTKKFNVYGVEPAKNVSKIAKKKGIKVFNNYFDYNFSKRLKSKEYKLIICNNVFAHIPNIKSFMRGLKNLCSKKTIITIEIQYLNELIKNNLIDMIYHEHFYYHNLKSLIFIFNEIGLEIFNCEKIKTHGGSLRIYVSRKNEYKKNIKINNIVKEENELFYNKIFNNKSFIQNNFENYYSNVLKNLANIKKNKIIVGFGAAAKATTLINIFNLNKDDIKFIIDETPYKQNCYVPGSNIKVISPEIARKQNFDVVIIFAWNYLKTVQEKIEYFFGKKENVVLIPNFKKIK